MSQTIVPVLGEATVQELREAVQGEIVTPEDDGYAEARRIWNGAHDGRRPALVVRCKGPADVIGAVGFARSNDLTIAVRGGGHSVAGFSTSDGGIVIDLSQLNGVRVDPAARRATVGGGAVWADVDHETQTHGLATTGGLVSSTGVAGFTLGGGIGWTMRKFGLACDNLVGADVVTADGRLVHASETENADLLWGLRGGSSNFGVVTSFEFQLHPVGPIVLGGLRHIGPPAMDLIEPMPYVALQAMLDDFAPKYWQNYHRGIHLDALPDAAIDAYLDTGVQTLSPMTQAILFRHGGAVARVSPDSAAAGHRDAAYMAHPIACWADPAEDDLHIAWCKRFSEAMSPFGSGGVYLNFEQDEGAEHVRRGYDADTYARLVALKDKWDPTNVFRVNQNIAPSGSAPSGEPALLAGAT